MGTANERMRYYVTPSLIGRAHTQMGPYPVMPSQQRAAIYHIIDQLENHNKTQPSVKIYIFMTSLCRVIYNGTHNLPLIKQTKFLISEQISYGINMNYQNNVHLCIMKST